MSDIRVSRVANALVRKGFETYQSHHLMYWLVVQGKKTAIRTRISHGARTADDWLLAPIARQLHLSKRELVELVECTISGEQYIKLMIERRRLTP